MLIINYSKPITENHVHQICNTLNKDETYPTIFNAPRAVTEKPLLYSGDVIVLPESSITAKRIMDNLTNALYALPPVFQIVNGKLTQLNG